MPFLFQQRARAPTHTALLPQLTSLDLARCKNSSMSFRVVWTRGTRRARRTISSGARRAGSPERGRSGRRDRLLPPTARRRLRLWLRPRPSPRRAPAPPRARLPARGAWLCPNKESGCDAREPQGAPRTLAGTRLRGRSSGPGLGGGGVGGWRAAPPPIAGPRCGLLTWRAERCCNHGQRPEVRAKCKGLLQREALPQAPPLSARGSGKRGREAPRESLPPRPAPPWLAGWQVTKSSSGHLMSWLC